MKVLYLILYAVLMCAITVRSIQKKKPAIYTWMWVAYSVSAVFCVLCKIFQEELVGVGTYHNMWYDLSDTTLWGYLLITLCCLIAFRPFALFDANRKLNEFGRKKWEKQFFKLYALGYILCVGVFVLFSFNRIVEILGVSDFATLRTSLYSNTDNESSMVLTTNFIANLCYKVCLQLKYLSIFVSVVMIKEKIARKRAWALLIATVFLYYVYASANAARGGLLIFVFCVMLLGITFYKYMSQLTKRKVLIAALIAGSIVGSFFIAVTVSRFSVYEGSGNLILQNVCFYLGHGPIEFSKITGSLESFAFGEVILGRISNHYFGTPYSWDAIQQKIGYPGLGPVFVTYLAWPYVDFGVIGCITLFGLWSEFMCMLLRKSWRRISTVYLFMYYLSFFVTGLFSVGRAEYVAVITAHLIWLAIRLIEDILKRKYGTHSCRWSINT